MTHDNGSWRTGYVRCAADGCLQVPRKWSRYCPFHYRRLERTRDLRGRVLTKGELRGHQALALEFLERNPTHPAVVAAHEHMAALLTDDGRATFLRREFNRLRDQGATPRAMVAAMLAMYGWQECHERELADRCFDLNLGRAVLRVVPARKRTSRTGRTEYLHVRPGHAEALGQHLRHELGLFAVVAAKRIAKEEAAMFADRQSIKEALEAVPFVSKTDNQTTGDDETE